MRKLWSVGDCEVDDGEAGEDTDEDEDCGQGGGFENYMKKTFLKKFNLGKALLPASLSGLGLNHS